MKVIAYDKFKAGVTLDTLRPYLRDEVSNVWRLWKAGVVRENYARADVPGVVIVFECANLDEAKGYIADFPLTKAGLIEWDSIALDAPLPLEFLLSWLLRQARPCSTRSPCRRLKGRRWRLHCATAESCRSPSSGSH